jgi:hypothetical protein
MKKLGTFRRHGANAQPGNKGKSFCPQILSTHAAGRSQILRFNPPGIAAGPDLSILSLPHSRLGQNSRFYPARACGCPKIANFDPPGSAGASKSSILPQPRSRLPQNRGFYPSRQRGSVKIQDFTPPAIHFRLKINKLCKNTKINEPGNLKP